MDFTESNQCEGTVASRDPARPRDSSEISTNWRSDLRVSPPRGDAV